MVTQMTVLSRNKCVLKTQWLFFGFFFGIDYQKSPLYFSTLLHVLVVPPVVSEVIVKIN